MTFRPDTLVPLPALPDGLADAAPEAADTMLRPIDRPLPLERPRPDLPPLRVRSLRAGCYLLRYTILGSPLNSTYDGTFRVEAHAGGRTASGDIYQRPMRRVRITLPRDEWIEVERPGKPPRTVKTKYIWVLADEPSPAAGIPVFARAQYRWYLRATSLLEGVTLGGGFTLGFELMRWTAPNSWVPGGSFSAAMRWTTAPAGYPSSADYLEGDVVDAGGRAAGRLCLGWVSPYLRRASVEIDRVSVSEAPLANAAGRGWRAVFDEVGWDLTLIESDAALAEPSGESWSDAEAHAAMLAHRATVNLDRDWRYHMLAVRRLDSTPRGIMYDLGATDSNNVPREGVVISSHWTMPNIADWGLVRGQRFGAAADPYFRTAVHETGHAMGLFHNTVDMGFMNTTDVISAAAPPGTPFPNNIKWQFADDDLKRLRHYPDPFVRPGGVAFGGASTTSPPITPSDAVVEHDELALAVTPVLGAVPLGAPVRVDLVLTNTGDDDTLAPESLSLKSGLVEGRVTGPDGQVREFRPLVHCVESHPVALLEPGGTVAGSLTLLRGPQGALFPAPGAYSIEVEARWDDGGAEACVVGQANVMVTSAAGEAHAAAALKVLSEPDTLLALAIGGDHLEAGNAAIDAAMADEVLRPHFAYVEARRLGTRFGRRKADPAAARSALDDGAVLNRSEAGKVPALCGRAGLPPAVAAAAAPAPASPAKKARRRKAT